MNFEVDNICNIDYTKTENIQSRLERIFSSLKPDLSIRLSGYGTLIDNDNVNVGVFDCKSPNGYFIVYKAMREMYDKDNEDENEMYLSTSSILIPKFGNFYMKIYVPIYTPILVNNISKEVNIENVYEIILPKNTRLEALGYDKLTNYNIYVVSPQVGSGHNKPHFYINPLTGRLIKSDTNIFKELKRRRFKIDKDECLYNITSAKRCLKKILNKYKDKIYPSSKFADIPSTYHRVKKKRAKARGFIKSKNKKHIKGYVDKKGKLYKLPKPIKVPKVSIPEVETIPEHLNLLYNKLNTDSKVSSVRDVKDIKEQLQTEPLTKDINILHNPIQDDFIPIKKDLNEYQKKELLTDMNESLIPKRLKSFNKTNIAGIILDSYTLPTQIIGFTDTNNNTIKFDIPIKIMALNKSINKIPQVEITSNELDNISDASQKSKTDFLNNINKSYEPNEQFDEKTNKCYPCEYYDLVWDNEFKKCKLKDKSFYIIEDTTGNILGYNEK